MLNASLRNFEKRLGAIISGKVCIAYYSQNIDNKDTNYFRVEPVMSCLICLLRIGTSNDVPNLST